MSEPVAYLVICITRCAVFTTGARIPRILGPAAVTPHEQIIGPPQEPGPEFVLLIPAVA